MRLSKAHEMRFISVSASDLLCHYLAMFFISRRYRLDEKTTRFTSDLGSLTYGFFSF
jgi:hypothetical protein